MLVLTGPVGVGKTSVGAAVGARLAAADTPYAFVDADALRRYGPTPPDDPFGERVGLRNLAAVWATFGEAGTERLVLADVVESGEKVDGYREAVPGAEIVVVRLRANTATLERRLRGRESRDDLAWHLRRAPELDRIMDRAGVGIWRCTPTGARWTRSPPRYCAAAGGPAGRPRPAGPPGATAPRARSDRRRPPVGRDRAGASTPPPAGGAPARPFRVKAVIRRGGRYLLAVHDNRRPENKGKWTFLGGRIDPPDPSPDAALVRELREELGVAGRVLGEVGRYPYGDDPGPCVVLLAEFDGEPRPNEELVALRWFTRDEVEAIGRAGLLHMGIELDALGRADHLFTW